MPVLPNPKHEIVAQELAKGASQTEAYEKAGYKPNRQHASRLVTNGDVKKRVAELQAIASISAVVTIESLMEEAAQIQSLSVSLGQMSAATGALTVKAKLAGLWVDKTDNTNTNTNVNPSDVTDAEIAAVLKAGGSAGTPQKTNGKAITH